MFAFTIYGHMNVIVFGTSQLTRDERPLRAKLSILAAYISNFNVAARNFSASNLSNKNEGR
jgi:hypothetical protein